MFIFYNRREKRNAQTPFLTSEDTKRHQQSIYQTSSSRYEGLYSVATDSPPLTTNDFKGQWKVHGLTPAHTKIAGDRKKSSNYKQRDSQSHGVYIYDHY